MAALATQVVAPTGTALTFTAAAGGGDTCATGSDVRLFVKNGSGSSITVTLVTPGTVDGDLAIADRTVTVAASGETAIPMTDLYRNPSTGVASITYPGGVASVTVAVIR